MAKKDPLFLVVVDDSEEMHHALQFACSRASAIGGKVGLMYCIAPAEFEYWAGVGELMREPSATWTSSARSPLRSGTSGATMASQNSRAASSMRIVVG